MVVAQLRDEQLDRIVIGGHECALTRHLANPRVEVAQRPANRRLRRRRADARQCPDRVASHEILLVVERGVQRFDRRVGVAGERGNGPVAHGHARIAEPRDELRRRSGGPIKFQAAWIQGLGRVRLADTIERAEHVGARDHGRRAAAPKPGAGINDEQAAVCVLDDIREMHARIVRARENLRPAAI
jgi:hypothetical protein